MAASASSYQTLGLEPGAARSTVDAAYRALMKRHHPDLGGDPAIAAELNRAYAELTRPEQASVGEAPATDLAAALYARRVAARASRRGARRSRRRWPLWVAGTMLVLGAGWIGRESLADAAWSLRWQLFQPRSASADGGAEQTAFMPDAPARLDRAPIAASDIDVALRNARTALGKGGLGRAADDSALCYRKFAAAPTLSAYDRCVSFDNSVLLLAGAGAVDRGVFSAASLTARQLAAGRTLDADYDRIETRLDRLRTRTLRTLQPPAPVVIPPPAP